MAAWLKTVESVLTAGIKSNLGGQDEKSRNARNGNAQNPLLRYHP